MTAQAGSIISPDKAERRQLRQRMRAARRALSGAARATANRMICSHIMRLGAYRSARSIALFIAFDGEPDLTALVKAATRQGKRLYAPVITPTTMTFARLSHGHVLDTNFFGIPEPNPDDRIDPRRLDLVLTPLVAFDDAGVRVGVGRGYYDRCFSFLGGRGAWQRPKLLGVAYELQHVPALDKAPWDVPLWGAVTEAGSRRFARGIR